MNFRLLFFFLCFLFSFTVFSQKDTLVLANGDKLVGELKKMDRGVLTFKTSYSSGDLKVKWKKVKTIKSEEKFLMTSVDGKRFKITGLDVNREDKNLMIRMEESFVPIDDIVFIKSVKGDFISRLSASVSFGYNFTKASNLSQLTLASKLGFTSDYYSIVATFNAVRSSQDEVDHIQRTFAELSFNYFLKGDNFLILQSEYLSNSEQKLKLRVTNKLGFGRYFIHTNQMYLAGAVGVAWNNEEYEEAVDENRNSGEGYVALEVNLFDFSDLSLVSGITAYPSITEKGRVRTDYKLELKYDLPLDLFVKLGFNYNYDNKPAEGTAYDDYVIRTTLGWEL